MTNMMELIGLGIVALAFCGYFVYKAFAEHVWTRPNAFFK